MLLPCGDMHIGLDNGKGDVGFVSHAHADHLNGARKKERIIASAETAALAGLKGQRVLPSNVQVYPAGHMLGAQQIAVEHDGERTVYTGDICLHPTLTNLAAEMVKCDRLIIDATYGDPRHRFPAYENTVDEMVQWIRENDDANIIIGAYNMGKAQEITKILNEYCGIAPLVNERTEEICDTYGKFGISLDRVPLDSNEADEVLGRRFVAIVSMRHAKRYFARKLEEAYGRKTLAAVATGWALHYRFNVDRGFPFSDHADFHDLKDYIEQSGAKKVEFHSGDGKELLRACGFVSEATSLLNL